MMHLQLGVVSDFAYVDERGKLYILGEFQYIFGTKLPAVHRRLVLTCRVIGDKVEGYEHELKIELTDADGRKILPKPIEGPMKFSDIGPAAVGKMKAQVVVEFQGLKFDAWGDYSFQVFVNKQHLGAIPLTIAKAPGQKSKKRRSKK
jgi:hypothetical protein